MARFLPSRSPVYGFLLPAVLLIAGCNDSLGTEGRGESAMLVSVGRIVGADGYTIRREFAGRVEARRQSRIGFELGGELRDVDVEEGDRVAAGAVVARLDTARLDARRAEAQAALDEAVSARDFAEKNLERNVGAAAFDGISAQELDIARDRAAAARAALAAAGARLRSVEVDIAKATLRAPYDAVVTARHLDEGQIVSAGQAVVSVQEQAAPEVRLGIAGELASSLEPGQHRSLSIGGNTVAATVHAVLPLRDPATRTIDVILRLGDDEAALPGDLARLGLEQLVTDPGYWLPLNALAEGRRGLWTAYVAVPLDGTFQDSTGGTHRLEPRAVEILYEEADRVFVRGAVSGGDLFVTGGLQRIVPEQRVRMRLGVARTAAGNNES